MRGRFARHDPGAARYWALIGIFNGEPNMANKTDAWNWTKAAILHHFA
jgi:hypothetical protein